MKQRILHLTLYKQWFVDIFHARKKYEYREIKPFWTKRLEGREYDAIIFSLGYRKDRPEMMVEYLGWKKKRMVHPVTNLRQSVYAIKLGRILHTKNCNNM